MKRFLLVVLVLAVPVVSGCCAQYSNPERAEDLWRADYALCENEADYMVEYHGNQPELGRPGTTDILDYGPRFKARIRQCMEEKGYTYEDDFKKILLGG